jgi:hypothetical protein
VREGFGIDLEMSRPIGFFRLMDDLGPPKGDADGLEPAAEEAAEGDSREIGLGGAASLVEASGGCSDMVEMTIGRELERVTTEHTFLFTCCLVLVVQ